MTSNRFSPPAFCDLQRNLLAFRFLILFVGITKPHGIAPLDLLTRYPMRSWLMERFSPISIQVDRYISPMWLPFSLIGCTVCAIVYGLSRWRPGGLQSTGRIVPRNNPTAVRSVYLTALASLYLVRAFVVILIDLDTAWDTGLLAWNQLSCPLVHSLSTATKLSITLIILALTIDVLVTLYEKNLTSALAFLRFLFTRGESRKAVHITVGLITACCLLGLVETAYWRVQYYLPSFVPGISTGLNAPTLPWARCEVTGQFQYLFSAKLHKLTVFGQLDASGQHETSTRLAASYADYKWISGITVECILALTAIVISLAIARAQLMDDVLLMKRPSSSLTQSIQLADTYEVKHVAVLGIVHGLCRLPEALFLMLEPLTRPGEVNLTDSEVCAYDICFELSGRLSNKSWLYGSEASVLNTDVMLSMTMMNVSYKLKHELIFVQYVQWKSILNDGFNCNAARNVVQELSDIPAALMFPICLGLSKHFRRNFCELFGCRYRPKRRRELHLVDSPGRDQENRGEYLTREADHVPYSSCDLSEHGSILSPDDSQRYIPLEAMKRHASTSAMEPRTASPYNDGRPRWKWGQGWTLQNQPFLDPRDPSVGKPTTYRHPDTRSIRPSPYGAEHPAWQSTRFINDTYAHSCVLPQTPPYQRRAMSAHDLMGSFHESLVDDQQAEECASREVEWYEPRSYV
ncbi:hypothetical protein CLF_100332 [Clonorchis sinensis]|uniref:Uncharacterized protein n=1 Tax=Clonorchis sinensis TaxID=79923 RepID=G7Y381_CLOSI|nr:hypothetical protein CLF_100332 [Clonorchis sinensis]